MSAKKGARKSAKNTGKDSEGFTEAERAAMKERAKELKAEARRKKNREEGENDLLAKVAEMEGEDKAMAKRLHELITAAAPELMPKTWYGMPAYAKDGKVVCFFQSAGKFDARYATFGFNDTAKLDHGSMWPTSFALVKLTKAAEKEIVALVKQAVS